MAYFSNGSEGARFEEECSTCPLGEFPCPIAWIQTENNYDACENKVATTILNYLVKDNGECAMKKLILKSKLLK
jgi:hypothetical protein